ncbi:hypothetical protein B4U80_10095 [Leptotrombidium deliense]|uniref:N-acetyltransferase domain-containing protein n=1 Tax=Leptotrombidium deliense TaxID=299467 RepID=A0A443SBF4_9ACAR|nr:hypothetical protein B4U80_10095 [Leptotrombidium deliense]
MPVCESMKNRHIVGEKVVLVPYRPIHVEKYHQWMSNSDLQYLTASEPLTLAEEYEMQTSWVNDVNKCTFIVLDRIKFEESGDEVHAMIGDTNLFLHSDDNTKAEIEVMIAEVNARRRGSGKEAVQLMLRFAVEVIGLKVFEAKIKVDNIASQNMFTKMGFVETNKSDIFQEISYIFDVNDKQTLYELNCCTNHLQYKLL